MFQLRPAQALIILILLSLVTPPFSVHIASAIEISFSAEEGGEYVDLASDYDVDADVSVSEVAEATFDGQARIDDSRSLSGQGEIQVAQRYSGSSGYRGSAVFSASGSGSLKGSASLSPGFLSASQSVLGSGDSALAEMSLTNGGSSTVAGCNMASGSMTAGQSIWTGSAHSSQGTSFNAESGNTWQLTTAGGDTAFSRSGFGDFDPIHDIWSSQDGQHRIVNDLSGTGTYSLQGRVNALADSVSLFQLINIANGNLNSAQTARGSSNGENLLAMTTLSSSGSTSGLMQAGSSNEKTFASEQLSVDGGAVAGSLADAGSGPDSYGDPGSDQSKADATVSDADGLCLGTFALTFNNIFENDLGINPLLHRTQAGGDAVGTAGSVSFDAKSFYSDYNANSHGQWSGGYGDLNIGAKTVKAAAANVELKTSGSTADTWTDAWKGDTMESGLWNTASAGESGQMDKFQSHLYSHAYPASSYGLYDDPDSVVYQQYPDTWEEFVSTASGGVQGEGAISTIWLWEGGDDWTGYTYPYQSASGEVNTFRATDITSTLPGSEKWDQVWHGTVRTTTPEEQVPWGIKYMYNNPDLTSTRGGRGVDVAVLDSGVDTLHPDLMMRIGDYFDIDRVGYEYQKGVPDAEGHGTHVSGTIAADGGFDGKGIYGMAPEANLHEYRCMLVSDFALGIYRAADLGSDIISISFGSITNPGTTEPLWKRAGDYAEANDVLVVAAAGNGLSDFRHLMPTIVSPAKDEGVVAVGILDTDGRSVAWISSPGFNGYDGIKEYVMFAAPGMNVLSTTPTYADCWYQYKSGTSMATPHISGTAAKILSDGRYNGMSISQSDSNYVKGIMLGYAQNYPVTEVNGLQDPWLQSFYRSGRIAKYANIYAGTPPGDYYSALVDALARGDDIMVIPGDPHNNCLAGHGVPRLPAGST